MTEEVEKCNVDNILSWENTFRVKEEFENDYLEDNKVHVGETAIIVDNTKLPGAIRYPKPNQYELSLAVDSIGGQLSLSEVQNVISDTVKIEKRVSADDIKIEFDNGLLYCDLCQVYYEDYCTNCGMLVHILNRNALNKTDSSIAEEMPNDILEIQKSSREFGIFALKVIPVGVKFGPFIGLDTSKWPWKIKGGQFVVCTDKSKYLNWMQYIKPARNNSEQNMFVFQREGNLYYRSTREIREGEELLVYFGVQYEDSLANDLEMDFLPTTEQIVKDVFACTFCCFGFSSRTYLIKHKTVCLNDEDGRFSVGELAQCPFCKIYLNQQEYDEYHMANCCKRNSRKLILPALNVQKMEETKRERRRRHMYKCNQCSYKTPFKAELNNHTNQHYGVKTYTCGMCRGRFKTKEYLDVHVDNFHVKVEAKETDKDSTSDSTKTRRSKVHRHPQYVIKCAVCQLPTKHKAHMNRHDRRMHLKGDEFKCGSCSYKTHIKSDSRRHLKIKHSKALDYKCESCEWKTSIKSHLKDHIKSKHLRVFDYACESCDYKTNLKTGLQIHVKTKHLKEFGCECHLCDYKTNNKWDFKIHIKSKHLETFDYRCDWCEYRTNRKIHFEAHKKGKHLEQFDHRCDLCDYKTNTNSHLTRHVQRKHVGINCGVLIKCDTCGHEAKSKSHLEIHIKTIHLNEFDHKCESCDFKTNRKSSLELHIKTKHHEDFDYKCVSCPYKTNIRSHLKSHVQARHLKEFNHKCEQCDYKTNHSASLKLHINAKHLKEFRYNCATCNYRTNKRVDLERHVKTKHLQVFDYRCASCKYRTNRKTHFEKHVRDKHFTL